MIEVRRQGCACAMPGASSRWLLPVMALVAVFAGVELWVGAVSHSLTLRADSGHMFGDVGALALALCAARLAQRTGMAAIPKQGNHPLEVGAALVNGVGLVAIAAWVGREALLHLQGPPQAILTWPMLVTACLGLLINGFNLYWLHGHSPQDLNLRGAFLHILADLLGSLGAIAAALAVTYLGWLWADVYIGLGVAVIVGGSALSLLWQCWQRFCSPTPRVGMPETATLEAMGWCEVGQGQLSRLIESR